MQFPEFNSANQIQKHHWSKNNSWNNNRKTFFNCSTCNKGFKSTSDLDIHISEHVKCDVEYCTYVACPMLVLQHYETQHLSGLAPKIWKLTSEKEIERWREERRRNFPTDANIARKVKEKKKKRKAGICIETKYFGKMKKKKTLIETFIDEDEKLFSSSTTDQVKQDENFQISDSDSDIDTKPTKKIPKSPTTSNLTAAGALGSLMTAYSDSDDDSEEVQEVPSTSLAKENQSSSSSEASESDSDSAPEVVTKANNLSNKKRLPRPNDHVYCHGRYRKPSLLEMLLAKEIRHERNLVMQCCTFIVKNGFFGLEKR